MGINHKGALLVMRDKATLHTKLHGIENRNSSTVSKTMIQSLLKSKYPIHTVTFDNDKGFADHMMIAKALNTDTYFTRPYSSQDKGTDENRIGKIRRFPTKKIDLIKLTCDHV
jgi:IS30 family transposase